MGRRRKGREINGILLLDKDLGGSSNHALQQVKRLFGAAKAGHTGALDPLASGMLPICLGEATKFSQFLLDADKGYEVTATLGVRTTTSDADGEVVAEKPVTASVEEISQACLAFIGSSKQVPSMYSALKHQGKPLYHYARQGIEIDRPARDIHIYQLDVLEVSQQQVSLYVHCSKGTYIRSLIDDLGQNLGCGAYVTRLHRNKVAHYPTEKMLKLDALQAIAQQYEVGSEAQYAALDALLLPMDGALSGLPTVRLEEVQAKALQHGQAVNGGVLSGDCLPGQLIAAYYQQQLLGVVCMTEAGALAPRRLVVSR